MRAARRQAGHGDRVRFGSVLMPGGLEGGFLVKDAGNDLHAHAICGWHQLAMLGRASVPSLNLEMACQNTTQPKHNNGGNACRDEYNQSRPIR